MSVRTAAEIRKRLPRSVASTQSFRPQQCYVASQNLDMPASAQPRFGHDFSRVRVLSDAKTGSCPLRLATPLFCPFGGVCHTCPASVQAKLNIGRSDDRYEQEADSVANTVMSMSRPKVHTKPACPSTKNSSSREEELVETKPLPVMVTPLVPRQAEKGILQTEDAFGQDFEVEADLESRIQALHGGQPLPESVRAYFESRFGYDFSRVRVHTDSKAAQISRELDAEAFTYGGAIYFGAGRPPIDTSSGRKLLAHELTHVIQQSNGPAIQRTNGESLSHYTVGGTTYYTSYLTVGELIVGEARMRRNNPVIRRAYSSVIPWFFTRNPNLAGFTTEEQARQSWKKDTMCTEMPELSCEYSGTGRNRRFVGWTNYPLDEGSVWWGSGVYTCNVYVYDVLYNVGLSPPLMGNDHYFDPSGTYNMAGALADYFDDVPADEIRPGDIFATTGHMEIVTFVSRETIESPGGERRTRVKSFSSIGAGKDGIGVSESSGVTVTGRRFRRVK